MTDSTRLESAVESADASQPAAPRRQVAGRPIPVRRAGRWAGVALCAVAIAGCAGPREADEAVYDPFEDVNRAVFAGNEFIDDILLRPVAEVYQDYFPEALQDRVRDMLRHLRSPLIFANEILQGDFEGAGNVASRFFINSVAGVGGFVDVANHNGQGIPFEGEDFGQTLAVWGVDSGPYLVLPILGPSNVRDTVGRVVELLADPIGIIATAYEVDAFNYGRLGFSIVDARARVLDQLDALEEQSLDFYVTIRNLYTRMREAEIQDGELEADIVDIPDFDDFDEGGADDGAPQDGAPQDGASVTERPAGLPAGSVPSDPGAGAVSALPAPSLTIEPYSGEPYSGR